MKLLLILLFNVTSILAFSQQEGWIISSGKIDKKNAYRLFKESYAPNKKASFWSFIGNSNGV